jgi:CRISPR/Cas system CMR-associated protein Cmr1 (group 7 of RAMP superfamily)
MLTRNPEMLAASGDQVTRSRILRQLASQIKGIHRWWLRRTETAIFSQQTQGLISSTSVNFLPFWL